MRRWPASMSKSNGKHNHPQVTGRFERQPGTCRERCRRLASTSTRYVTTYQGDDTSTRAVKRSYTDYTCLRTKTKVVVVGPHKPCVTENGVRTPRAFIAPVHRHPENPTYSLIVRSRPLSPTAESRSFDSKSSFYGRLANGPRRHYW